MKSASLWSGPANTTAPEESYSGDLGPVAAPATYAPYEVREIRSVLTAGTG